ncbi:PGPGW domain-containing protein [Sneathiella limimaris]|uniref:PGPGW domain-containing protein n=1 Tax=Sneathiella limimaris TaxID=1964213 RepID=UPI00146C4DE1|nr:PGPGW domain-containing protein [Sneathiella limimaris]
MTKKKTTKKLKEKVKIPENKLHRQILGWALVLGGLLGFLPVVGFWMFPLGIVILSIDYPFARRLKRRVGVWWGRWQQTRQKDRKTN